ncbi:permease [Planomonospora sp. ID82291]|nr:permease [Planomonospora sp. ID82291]
MAMTHYMELLATNQPWNLLMFMAAPVVLAETVAITELALLFNRDAKAWVTSLNRWAGIIGGLYFLAVFGYLMVNAAIPLTTGGGWRGPIDVIAVGGYLSGVVPLFGIALLELRVLGRGLTDTARLKWHAAFVGLFLIVAHIAMIFGMLDPTLFGYHTAGHAGMHM